MNYLPETSKEADAETEELTQEKVDAFLVGLTKLTMETGVEIGGCGCCGSPYLNHLDRCMVSTTFGYLCELIEEGRYDRVSWERVIHESP